jgi:hypothetical protein
MVADAAAVEAAAAVVAAAAGASCSTTRCACANQGPFRTLANERFSLRTRARQLLSSICAAHAVQRCMY